MSRNHHPSRHPADDDDPIGDAAVARVNAIRAARGLDPLPAERDPAVVRLELTDERDAALIALAVLRPDRGAAVPDAIDTATAGHPPEVCDRLPVAVAVAIRNRLHPRHRQPVTAAVDPVLDRFENGDGGRALAELCVHRIGETVRATIAATIADELRAEHPDTDHGDITQASASAADITIAALRDVLSEYLLLHAGLPMPNTTTDADHENHCRHAAVLNALAQIRGDTAMQSEAVRLALIVCHDHPDMRPSDVFRAGAPLLMLPADASPAEVDAALVAELAALADDGAP